VLGLGVCGNEVSSSNPIGGPYHVAWVVHMVVKIRMAMDPCHGGCHVLVGPIN